MFDGIEEKLYLADPTDLSTVTVEEFRAWLKSKWGWQRVGAAHRMRRCPLARYMLEARGVQVSVGAGRTPRQQGFVNFVDAKAGTVTKNRALRILSLAEKLA